MIENRGVVLVTCLWVLSLLTLLVLSLTFRLRLLTVRVDREQDEVRADALLQASLARGLASLRQDTDLELDHLAEGWALSSNMNQEGLLPERYRDREESVLQWRMVDEESKINLNTVQPSVLVEVLDVNWGREINGKELVETIADWIDSDASGGAEEDYYRSLPVSYQPRNQALPVLEELLSLRGVTPALFWGEDGNGNGQLEENEDDGERLPPMDNQDGRLEFGLRDLFTVNTDGTVNINTIRTESLEAVFRVVVDRAEAQTLARKVEQARSGPDAVLGTADDTPIVSTPQLAEIIGVPIYQKAKQLGVPFGVKSNAFTLSVTVDLREENLLRQGRGLLMRSEQGIRLVNWQTEMPF